MAYVYQNGSLGRALGDAAYDQAYAKYVSDHAAWQGAVNVYRSALASWQANEAYKSKAYAEAKAAYNAYLANYAAQRANWAALKVTLPLKGVSVPSDFAGCVSKAQHAAWQKTCDEMSSVKGLGALPTGPACELTKIPVCTPIVGDPIPPVPAPAPTPPGPEPQPPVKPVTPPPPVQQQIPTPAQIPTTNIPASITPSGGGGDGRGGPSQIPTTSSTVPAATKSGGMLSSGLILLVVAGGGYALYRTFKKPKRT